MKTISAIMVISDLKLKKPFAQTLATIGGIQCTFCTGGLDALAHLKKQSFQILYSDLMVDDMSGVDLVHQAKKAFPAIYALVGASHGTVQDVIAAMRGGADDFIIDPFEPELIVTAFKKPIQDARKDHLPNPIHQTRTQSFLTRDKALLGILDMAKKVAPSTATVLITGESGTGKELLASFIHANSSRKNDPYVAINCAALPEQLAESELFGHEKGAFTGAISRKIGKFESAEKGTLVLDEITEMALPLQAKLLRALQEREIVRLGSNRPVGVAARVIAVSNQNMNKAVTSGVFREDLFYRLNVIPLTIPPLRARKNDIPLLADYFFKRFCRQNEKRMTRISDQAIRLLSRQSWTGNVRELENTIERGVLLGSGEELLPEHLLLTETVPEPSRQASIPAGLTVREMEKDLIFNTLKTVNDNRTHAAKMLGISIRTLRNKLNEYREEMGMPEG